MPRPARGPQAPEAALTAAARKIAAWPSPLAVFTVRREARALLWQAGKFDLHEAVDELQAAAVRDGLVTELGQDRVQALIVEAFAPLRNDLRGEIPAVESILDKDEFHLGEDESQQGKSSVAAATIMAAEYLIHQGNTERFRNWLDRHSADERTAIRRHLEAKRCH